MLKSIFHVRYSHLSWEVTEYTTQFHCDFDKYIFEGMSASLKSSMVGYYRRNSTINLDPTMEIMGTQSCMAQICHLFSKDTVDVVPIVDSEVKAIIRIV